MMQDKLRIGLLIDNDTVPNWAYCMLERICTSGHSEISLLVTKSPNRERDLPSSRQDITDSKKILVRSLYEIRS